MNNVYYIGGSPCSGKSTIAEQLAIEYNMTYFKVDDHLERYTMLGAKQHLPICLKQQTLSPEEIWRRDVSTQSKEELAFYKEIFPFIQEDLLQFNDDKPVITEGASFLPHLMKTAKVSLSHYIALVPTADFQIFHYKQREWVPYVLKDCSDQEKAFANWMNRDIAFAKDVILQCEQENYPVRIIDGSVSIEETKQAIIKHFQF
ncbi:hypothetical protein [Anaerosporobacter faecicola]|uniref:hypothetical protein n=1 Tax=Anaerosporobacter faecicola TaxID=2718714 RepID=UPI001438F7C9|nr:hypothetical protein [Anaerosporobacter faecicola]